MDELAIRRAVRDAYARPAEGCGCDPGGGCCAPDPAEEPGVRKLGVSDPIRFAGLRPGERVVDLGSGPGADILRAAALVGPSGRAIGVDATPEMVLAAREAARRRGAANAEFRLGEIEHLPVGTGEADVVLSDCVVNLSPDKGQALREAFRILRPRGRFVLADVVAREGTLAQAFDPAAWAGCVAGAVPTSEYVRLLEAAGFRDVRVVHEDLRPGSPVGTAVLVAIKPAGRRAPRPDQYTASFSRRSKTSSR